MKHFLKSLLPPIAVQTINVITGRNIQWIGEYSSWEEASSCTRGYDPDIYLDKLIHTTQIVKNDNTKSERDSVLFDKIIYPYPLLSNLFAITSFFQAKSLYILDFGGSLGSLYFQNRKFLQFLPSYTWNILEQDKIIAIGKKFFQTDELFFHADSKDAKKNCKPSDIKILILSSVLQYLEDPYITLSMLIKNFEFDGIIVDRTPFSKDKSHHIVIQKVPKSIYKTQYPCHLFSKSNFLKFLYEKNYKTFDEFDSYCDTHTSRFNSLGFSFIKD